MEEERSQRGRVRGRTQVKEGWSQREESGGEWPESEGGVESEREESGDEGGNQREEGWNQREESDKEGEKLEVGSSTHLPGPPSC